MNMIVSRFIVMIGLLLMLVACGGGGSSPSSIDNPQPVNTSSSSIKIAKAVLQQHETTSVTAKFVDSNGNPAAGISAVFSSTLGTLVPANGIVVTDSTGTATAQLSVGTLTGSGIVTVNATVGDRKVVKSASFSVNLPPLVLTTPKLGLSSLSYGGSTSVTLEIHDANDKIYTDQDVDVVFTSTQVVAGKASLPQTVRSVKGVVSATYKANTVVGTDTISVFLGDSVQQVSLTVNPADASSIQFVSAVPINIGLKGMGGSGIQETSTVTFKVIDVYGQPRANQQVSFSLNTQIGGLKLTSLSGSTASDGTVSTIVQAGTIATAVRITATLVGTAIATQSDQLVVSTGVPAQDGFSISMSKLNTESFGYDGVQSIITARLSDHFHNPVPDGTAVYFTTSGGSIQPSCVTTGGSCSVNWTSQNPRPANGRAVILAYSVGEEAFVDLNGNGVADPGEFTDMTGAFRDDNETGFWDSSTEPPIPFKSSGYDPADGLYNGILQGAAYVNVNAPKSKHVFQNVVHVMGSSNVGYFEPKAVTLESGTTSLKSSKSVTFTIRDEKGNSMPAGTTVSTNWSSYSGSLDWYPSYSATPLVIPDISTRGGAEFTMTINNSSSYTSSSIILFTVTTPNKHITNIPVTFSWTGLPLSVSPLATSFLAADKMGSEKTININGGKPSFTVTSDKPDDIAAALSLSGSTYVVKVSLMNDPSATPAASTAKVTVTDSDNASKVITVTYFK